MSAQLEKLQELLEETVADPDFDPDELCGLALAKKCKGYADLDRSDQSTLHLISCILLHSWRAHVDAEEGEEEDEEDEAIEAEPEAEPEAVPEAEPKAEPKADLEEGEIREPESRHFADQDLISAEVEDGEYCGPVDPEYDGPFDEELDPDYGQPHSKRRRR